MGTRSDVALAIRKHVFDKLSSKNQKFLLSADEVLTHKDDKLLEDGRLFIFRDYKWYFDTDENIMNLCADLTRNDCGDYLIVEACSEYPESTDGCIGGWYSNPWRIRKYTTVELEYEYVNSGIDNNEPDDDD